ncbi:hypothetical protein ACHAWO_002401 [Cyclotella atomus]|uniref:PPIase cyclophilin-type domain-containing protein n=1 Tax=Cyclotella atomus TaxID=382360 RepID=A0ABD3QH75_9STRA
MRSIPSILRALYLVTYISGLVHAFQFTVDSKARQSTVLSMRNIPSSHVSNRKLFIDQVVAVGTIAATAASAKSVAADATSDQPQITHKVFFDVRVSRSDGTFYIRDSNVNGQAPGDGADEPFYGQLVFGLFGTKAPNHVKQFLSYVDVPYEVDNPLPSYSRSRFTTLDVSSGLLIGGAIPGLDVTTLAGGSVLEYGGRVLPAKLWLEEIGVEKLSHSKKGLLTHRDLDVTPTFGITTAGSSTALDSSHTVFGCVLEDKGGFLDRVLDVPVLTESGKVSRTEINTGDVEGVGESIASSLFTAQRKVFRDAAKTFGDSRLEKVYDGKLLRRIDVSKVGVI